jgi:periplasmic protein CpxP/Spy
MKRQILSLIAGATLIMAPLATGMMSPASAQGMGGRSGMPERLAKELNLSETQKTQLKALKEKTKSQIEGVLTPEQKTKLQAERQQRLAKVKSGEVKRGEHKRGEGHGMFKSLNLSDGQKAQIKSIMKASRTEMENILTEAQKAQLKQKKAQWKAQRQR